MALAHFQRTFTGPTGVIQPGINITIRNEATGALAAIYVDKEGATSAGNPLKTDGSGYLSFYAKPGRYRIMGPDIDWRNEDLVTFEALEEAVEQAGMAADAAILNAGLYESTTAGLAATAEGDYFSVPSAELDEYVVLYRNDAGTATAVDTYPNKQAVNDAVAEVNSALSDRVLYVDSIADLQALNTAALKDGQAIYLTEEGRAGEFVVKNGTPPSDPQQGIYVVLGSDTYAERIYSGALNVQWFGARGDGIYDDSPHIQAALDLYIAMDQWAGVRLFFPAGAYNLVTPLNPYKPTFYDSVGNVSTTNSSLGSGVQPSVTFESAGRSSVVLVTTGSAIAPDSGVVRDGYDSFNSFFFKGIVFKGRADAQYPVEFDGANVAVHKMVFDDCDFSGYEYGFYLNRTGWVSNTSGHSFLSFNDCNFLGNVYGALIGVDNVLFNDCYITRNNRDGLILANGYNVRLENGKIEFNGWEDNTLYSQIVLQVGAGACSFNSVYIEPAKPGLTNAGHKMMRLIPNPLIPGSSYISSISFIGCYINGGLSTRLMEVASGVTLEGLSIANCNVVNFGLGPDNLLIENRGAIRAFSSKGGRFANIVPSGGAASALNTGWEFLSSYPDTWSKDTSTIVASSEVDASSLPLGVLSSSSVNFGDGTAITYHTIELNMGAQSSAEFNPGAGLDLGVLYKDRNYSVEVQDVTSSDSVLARRAWFGIYRYDINGSSRVILTANREDSTADVGTIILSVQTVGRWR